MGHRIAGKDPAITTFLALQNPFTLYLEIITLIEVQIQPVAPRDTHIILPWSACWRTNPPNLLFLPLIAGFARNDAKKRSVRCCVFF